MKTILSNLEKQLEQIIIDHKDDVENDTYWRGVKIGLEVCVNLIKERLANSAKQSESNYNISLVSQQSELLLAFVDYYNKQEPYEYVPITSVERFLKANNCG